MGKSVGGVLAGTADSGFREPGRGEQTCGEQQSVRLALVYTQAQDTKLLSSWDL